MRKLGFTVLLIGLSWLGTFSAAQTAPAKTDAAQPGWKKYSYSSAGFSIDSPRKPREQHLNQTTDYAVFLTSDTFVHLSVNTGYTDCGYFENQAREFLQSPMPLVSQGQITASSKPVTINGHLAFVGEFPDAKIHAVQYHRSQCSNGRIYYFWARWPDDHPRPKDLNRVLNSFRLLQK